MAYSPALSARTRAHLEWAVVDINEFLGEFGTTVRGESRMAELHHTGEFIRVFNMPLPDRYQPDYCDLLLIMDDFPARPPTGLYLLNTDAALVAQMKRLFAAFHNSSAHGAASIPGYTWICYHFAGLTWRYRPETPAQGDTLRKFLAAFYAELAPRGRR